MPKFGKVDMESFVQRHVYESYFNCDYDGPTWTGDLFLDLKIIALMPVLYPEQLEPRSRRASYIDSKAALILQECPVLSELNAACG